ncbi:hypothetical protein BgiBS90_004671, partial [Biomphalaria glabrata]
TISLANFFSSSLPICSHDSVSAATSSLSIHLLAELIRPTPELTPPSPGLLRLGA